MGGVVVMLFDAHRPTTRALNGGHYTDPPTARDGYEGRMRGGASIDARRERIARELEIERLRASIHRCDETPIA